MKDRLLKLTASRINLAIMGLVLVIIGVGFYFVWQRVYDPPVSTEYDKICSSMKDGCGNFGLANKCNVPGVANRIDGKKFYTVPGAADHGQYREMGKVQWFCNEEDARAAGYRLYSEIY